MPAHCTLEQLMADVDGFREELRATKLSLAPSTDWYPYDILANVDNVDALLSESNRDIGALAGGLPIADIGGCDGDMAFLLARHGFTVDLVDYGPTSWNYPKGPQMLASALGSSVRIHEVDLDGRFNLPGDAYGLVLLLGTLYHLQNPVYVLRHLASRAQHLLLSTRVARTNPQGSVRIDQAPVAYLVDPTETNNDPTNWWIFSPSGLMRLFDRTGWDVLDLIYLGYTAGDSDPASQDRDERAYCLLRSRGAS